MNNRILYVSYDGMTDPLGQSQVLPYLIGLTRMDFQITLISFEKEERFARNKNTIFKICKDNNIDWHFIPYTKSPPVLSTLKDIKTLKNKIKDLHQSNPFSLIHCRSYITALTGLWMKKKYGVKLIFDMRGFWADERIDGKLWNLKNPVYRFVYKYFKEKEKQFIEQADYTISLTQNAKDIIHSWNLDNQPVPIKVIPCCVDLDLFDPTKVSLEQKIALKMQTNISENTFILSYIGSIGTWYMLPEMLSFYKRWLLVNPASIFLFVTPDDPQEILREARNQNIPENTIRIVSAQRIEVPKYLSISDFSIFFIKPVFSKKASSPTKQAEIMAMGVPVICNTSVGDTDYVVNEFDAGILVNEFTSSEYDFAINSMQKKIFDNKNIRQGAMQFFSLQEGINRYKKVYKKVLDA